MLSQASEFFKEIRKNYYIPLDIALGVDTNVLNYQIPGGMISNLASQLSLQKAKHLLPEVLKEVPRVRKDMGYPPQVTPTSQTVGSQAVVNVLLGERHKLISTEVKNYVRGLYGRPPAPLSQLLRQKVLGDAAPIDTRPADLLSPQMAIAAEEIAALAESEEDVISYAIFPQVAEAFFKRRSGFEPPICETEKYGFPPEKKEIEQRAKTELDFAHLFSVDCNLLFSETDILAYPVS